MVVFSHFFYRHMPNESLENALHAFSLGGVILFFNLSGFLVYKSINEISVGIFIVRRLAKIFPAYWFTVAIYLTLLALGRDGSVSAEIYVANLLLLQELVGGVLLFGHFWTLAVEMKFYAIVAILAPALRRLFPAVTLIAIFAVNALFYLKTGRGSTLLTNLPIFFSGVLVHDAVKNGWRHADLVKLGFYAVIVSASMLAFQEYNGIAYAVFVPVSMLTLCLSLARPMKSRFFSYFGRISYSLYLLHPVVGYRLETLLVEAGLLDLAAAAIAVLLSVISADIVYRLIEVPGVRFGRRLERFRFKEEAA